MQVDQQHLAKAKLVVVAQEVLEIILAVVEEVAPALQVNKVN
jgi:hypothetical protein